jgi:hypothetical protein
LAFSDEWEISGQRRSKHLESFMIRFSHQFMLLIGILLTACALSGCSGPEPDTGDDYLIRVGDSVVTVLDFKKAFEIAKTAYPHHVLKNPEVLREARLRLFNQLLEEQILLERAKELQITVSDAELDKAVAEIKSDYPEGVFEQMLLEHAVSYPSWEKGLKIRLLMEKLSAKELEGVTGITARDIAEYYEEHPNCNRPESDSGECAEDINRQIIESVRQKKAEESYKSWIKKLQKKYVIDINQAQWKKISAIETGE